MKREKRVLSRKQTQLFFVTNRQGASAVRLRGFSLEAAQRSPVAYRAAIRRARTARTAPRGAHRAYRTARTAPRGAHRAHRAAERALLGGARALGDRTPPRSGGLVRFRTAFFCVRTGW